jgi:hypothetical protein
MAEKRPQAWPPRMAERAGFEPAVPFPVHTLSKRARSAAPSPLHNDHQQTNREATEPSRASRFREQRREAQRSEPREDVQLPRADEPAQLPELPVLLPLLSLGTHPLSFRAGVAAPAKPKSPGRFAAGLPPTSIEQRAQRAPLDEGWRRGRDLNPRYPFGHTGFRNRRVQPLRHLSVVRGRRSKAAPACSFIRAPCGACLQRTRASARAPRRRTRPPRSRSGGSSADR